MGTIAAVPAARRLPLHGGGSAHMNWKGMTVDGSSLQWLRAQTLSEDTEVAVVFAAAVHKSKRLVVAKDSLVKGSPIHASGRSSVETSNNALFVAHTHPHPETIPLPSVEDAMRVATSSNGNLLSLVITRLGVWTFLRTVANSRKALHRAKHKAVFQAMTNRFLQKITQDQRRPWPTWAALQRHQPVTVARVWTFVAKLREYLQQHDARVYFTPWETLGKADLILV